MHEMERNILDYLISLAMYFHALYNFKTLVADSLIYLAGPLPDLFCKLVIMVNNAGGLGINLSLEILCLLR